MDAPGLLDSALKRAIARSSALHLSDTAERELEVEVIGVSTPLAGFAEPRLRAAQYEVRLSVRVRMFVGQKKVVWSSPIYVSQAPYVSTPGQLVALDGAGRRALQQAAEISAERLVVAVGLVLDGELQ